MSLRPTPKASRSDVGSIFGPAVQIWSPMCLTPPTSPEEVVDFTMEEFTMTEPLSKLPALESAVQLFLVEQEELFACAYVFFSKSRQTSIISEGSVGPRLNRDPIVPHIVHAGMVVAVPVLSATGEEGTAFNLVDEEVVASVEVYSQTVVVVHASYSPVAARAGQVPASTRLVFGREHHEQLLQLLSEVEADDDLLYAPMTEILVGKGLDRLPLRGNDEQRRLWSDTKDFFRTMNGMVVRGIERHNQNEFRRAGVGRGELPSVHVAALFS